MKNIKELKEDVSGLENQITELENVLVLENRSAFSENEFSRHAELSNQLSQAQAELNTAELLAKGRGNKSQAVERSAPVQRAISAEDESQCVAAWSLHKSGNDSAITDKMARAVERCQFNLNSGSFIARAQTTSGSAGGYTGPGVIYGGLDKALKAFGGIRNHAKVMKTANGNPLKFATLDDTANVGAIVAENTAASNTSLTFGQKTLGSFKYTSNVYPVSIELIQDSAENIGQIVGEALGERIGRATAIDFTVGAGTTLPFGAATEAATGVTTTVASTAASLAEWKSLIRSVNPAYRAGAKLYMNDNTYSGLEDLVNAEDEMVMRTDYVGGGPRSFMGYEIVILPELPDMASATTPVLFGDMTKFVIRDVGDIEIKVLNELYALQGSVAYVAFYRGDSKLLNTAALKKMVMKT